MTLSDYADRWLTQLPHRVSARTVDAYRGALVRHILPHFGTRELASLHRRDIRSWCQGHLGTLAPNTVASLLTCLQALCTAAMDAVDAPHWLFSPGGDWPATRSTLQQHLRRIAKRAGLPAGLRVHDLRHSYSARLLELGAPMDYIQGQLGHASVVTTRRYTMGAEPPPTTALVDQLDAGLTEVRVRRPPHQIPPRLRLVRQRGVR